MIQPGDPAETEASKRLAHRFFFPILAISAAYTLAMHFTLSCEWAAGATAMAFVATVQSFVPMLSALIEHSVGTPCFLLFVAGFWCISPVFLLFGVMFIVSAPPAALARMRVNKARVYALAVPFIGGLFALVYCAPLIHGFRGFNNGSDSLPVQLISWGMISIVVWMLGLTLGAVWVRFSPWPLRKL
jgi:hypothetical protein